MIHFLWIGPHMKVAYFSSFYCDLLLNRMSSSNSLYRIQLVFLIKLLNVWTSRQHWMRSFTFLNELLSTDYCKGLWLSVTLQYTVLSGDGFESPLCFLQLFIAVALGRRPSWHWVPPLNHLSDLFKVILRLVTPRFEMLVLHSNLTRFRWAWRLVAIKWNYIQYTQFKTILHLVRISQ